MSRTERDNFTKKIDAMNNSSWENRYTLYEESLKSAIDALKLSEEINYLKGLAYSRLNLAVCYFLRSDNEKSLPLLVLALEYFDQFKFEKGYIGTLVHIGNIYESYGEYEKALEYCHKALISAKEIGYKEGEADVLAVIGMIYTRLADYSAAQKSYFESLNIRRVIGTQPAIASSLNRLAQSYCLSGDYEKALEYYSMSREIRERIKKYSGISWTYLGMASAYEFMGKLDKSDKFYSMGANHEETDIRCKAQCLIGSGRINRKLNRLDKSIRELDEALGIVQKLNAKPLQYEIHLELAKYYEKKDDAPKALENYKKYHSLKEEVLNSESSNRLKNQQIVFAIEKSEKEKEIFQLRNVELKSAYDVIAEKNKEITDSIRYAKRIQTVLLPKENYLKEILPNYFILYLPKDIVSGDFYWASKVENKTIIVAADSTGHGVPGAFMSMLGASFLDNIVNIEKILEPARIIEKLREHIIGALKQRDEDVDSNDGMDLAICVYDETTFELTYAGAYNPLCLIQNGKLEVIGADRMPVGISSHADDPFTQHTFKINKGDKAYMFSDGYLDQFGGVKGRKLKSGPFMELLRETSNLGIEMQKQALFDFFIEWKGDETQIDDVIVIGIEF